MRNIFIIIIISVVCFNKTYSQDLLNSYSTGSISITPARMKYFDNNIYIAANVTINNQTFPSVTKLDNNGTIIWQTRLDQQGIVSDLEFVPQSGISGKDILLVGETVSPLTTLDNMSFIWKVNDTGTHITCKLYNHTGNEGFTRIILHPNPIDVSYKYYITGRRNVVFPTTATNPSNSYKTLLYNIDENLNVNWSKNFEVTTGVPAGNEAQFFNAIVPLPNGELYLLGSTFNLNTLDIDSGVRMTVNVNNATVTGTGYRDRLRHEIKDGFFLNGEFHSSGYIENASFQKFGDINRLFFFGKTITNLSSFNGIVGIGNDLYTISEKTGNPNAGKVMINRFNYTTTPFYTLNYSSSVSVTPSGVSTPFINSQLCIDGSNNILFSSSTNGALYFGRINSNLNSSTATSCYLPQTFSTANTTNDGNSYQWSFLTETNTVTTSGQGISFNLTKTTICSPPTPCVLTVGFTNVSGNCGEVTFTPTVSGGTGPYNYTWDINCSAPPAATTTQNPTYTYDFPASGTYDVCLTVTDASGTCIGSTMMSITVIKDNVPPILTCPVGNVQLNTNPEYCYAFYGGVSATDNCGVVQSITCVLSGATTGTFTNVAQIQYNKGVTSLTCTATDDSGNVSAPCMFTVTVFDSEPPGIVCPPSISVAANQCDNGAVVNFLPPTIYDNCPMATYSCSHNSGSFFPCGNTIVSCTVTDMGGALASCSFNVNVSCSNNCPVVEYSELMCGTSPNTLDFTVYVINNNPAANACTYTLSLPAGQGTINSSTITPGITTVITGTLTPANNTINIFNLAIVANCVCQGNQPQVCNLMAVLDNIEVIPAPPNIVCPGDITLNTILNQCFAIYGGVSASDNCDINPSITCTLSGATTGVFTNVVELQYNKGVTLVECVATDSDGATSQCSFTVTVVDNQLPSIICPANVSAQVTDCSNTAAVLFPVPVLTDNCPMVQYTCTHQSNDIFNCGNTMVTCTATDMAGNTASCSFNVEVLCECVDIVSSLISCDKATNTYVFSISIINNSGAGSTCTSVINLDPAEGVILNQSTSWNGNNGTITGVIQPTLVAPFTFNLSIESECTCSNGQTQNCTSDVQYPITEVCTDFVLFDKVYGDGGENYTSVIKAFGNGIYVAGYFIDNGNEVATFTKFNAVTGALLWEKKLSTNTRIRDFDYNPDDPTTFSTNEETLILVGHTTPLSAGGVDMDNKSFIIGLFPNGILKFSKQFDFTGREQINKVERHKNPSGMFNFYAVGVKNQNPPAPIPSSWDQTMLINFDINGNVNWIRDYTYRSFPSGDDEILRGLISLNDGSIIITGNDVPRNDGIIVRINGVTGVPIGAADAVFANNSSPAIDFYDGLELPNGDIIMAGEWFGRNEAIMCVFSKGNLSAVETIKLIERFPAIRRFEDVQMDANGDLYVIGHNKDNLLNPGQIPIVVKLRYLNGFLTVLHSKYLFEGSENFYLNPSIHVTPTKDKLYYADTRNNLGFGFGLNDILVGAFDLNLTSNCSFDVQLEKFPLPILRTSFPISSILSNTPSSNIINLIPLSYQCADFCGPNCDVTALFEAVPTQCYEMQFNDLSSGSTGSYTYEWDFDCTNPIESTSQNPTWTFPGAGTYTVCLTVTDASGLCSSSTMQTVIVPPDMFDPDLICPPDITLNTDMNQCFATYGGVSATDNCSGSVTIVCSLSGATTGMFTNQGMLQYNKGVTTVFCVATDEDGNTASCSFVVTVEDNQLPSILCPSSQSVSAPFCDGGAFVNFNQPVANDNCPMVTFIGSHSSGDFFPCGLTTVTYIATDMSGNTSSCSFDIIVECTCTNVVSTEIQCGSLPDTYDFSLIVENQSGNVVDTCILVLSLNPANGIVTNQQIIWVGTEATITGTIESVIPVPSFFNFTLVSTCVCPDMTQTVCSQAINLIPPCCKSAFLTEEEICKTDTTHTISLNFNGTVNSIYQVAWYITFDQPCPADIANSSWIHYSTVNQNSADVDIYPPFFTADKFCMYAVVKVNDFPCTELITDIAQFTLCEPVTCTLSSQEICYYGNPVLPAPITLTPGNTSCSFHIEWLDSSGNTISGASNQLSYQPPPLVFSGQPDDCRQEFTYAARIEGICGPEVCYGAITLVNDAAPYGQIVMDPLEQQPFCPGEDATLRFITECHVVEGMETWGWFQTNSTNASGIPVGFSGVTEMGFNNPMLHTNILQTDTWIAVKVSDGICPSKVDTFFIDVYKKAVLTQFVATPLDPCRTTGVNLTAVFSSPDCPVIIDWFKDGFLIHTSTHSSSPASFNFQYSGITGDYSGNYHIVLRNSCCPDQFVNSINRVIEPPMQLILVVPCNIKGGETVVLEAVVMNAAGACSFEWLDENSNSLGSGSTINVSSPGNYNVIATCGPCVTTGQYELIECCPVSVNDHHLFKDIVIYPNPTFGSFTIKFSESYQENGEIHILNLWGSIIRKVPLNLKDHEQQLSLKDEPAGVYMIKVISDTGQYIYKKLIKIE